MRSIARPTFITPASLRSDESQSWRVREFSAFINKSCAKYEDDCKSSIRRIAQIALDKIDNRDQCDYMNIRLNYGYDLGIVHGTMSFGNRLTMDEWDKTVQVAEG